MGALNLLDVLYLANNCGGSAQGDGHLHSIGQVFEACMSILYIVKVMILFLLSDQISPLQLCLPLRLE